MARARYRRRDDGVHEIVRRSPLARAATVLVIVLGTSAVVAALSALLAIYMVFAVPLVAAVALFFAAQCLWRRRAAPAVQLRAVRRRARSARSDAQDAGA
jgi:type IV secretory pathway TrbD component